MIQTLNPRRAQEIEVERDTNVARLQKTTVYNYFNKPPSLNDWSLGFGFRVLGSGVTVSTSSYFGQIRVCVVWKFD